MFITLFPPPSPLTILCTTFVVDTWALVSRWSCCPSGKCIKEDLVPLHCKTLIKIQILLSIQQSPLILHSVLQHFHTRVASRAEQVGQGH
jgi:hypothetical protein